MKGRWPKVLSPGDDYADIDAYLLAKGVRKIFLVHGKSARDLRVGRYFFGLPERLGISLRSFTEFHPNPAYESVVSGVKDFREHGCDMVVALGGGSAIDVSKCIKLYADMPDDACCLPQEIRPNDIPLLAVPTTAGTGSETTRYAVIYLDGEKQSISHETCIPEVVCMDPSVLVTLPFYHRASSMLDALCHAMESWWSVNSTVESREYSREAMRLVLQYGAAYMQEDSHVFGHMMQAAHLAGKAIDITQTTAGHAMCYKLTSRYGIAHGHAAALCDAVLWPYMMEHLGDCCDVRGEKWLAGIFGEMAETMGCGDVQEAAEILPKLLKELGLERPSGTEEDLEFLVASVNPVRLRNHPVQMGREAFRHLYAKILAVA